LLIAKGAKMTNKSKNINDIVSQTARALGSGKSFGGWTDKVEENTYKRHVKKQHASREREKKEKEEPLVIHGPDGTRENPQYSKFTYPKDIKKESFELNENSFDSSGFALARGLLAMREEMDESWGGAASGAATGAMIGTYVPIPGVGTLAGAAIGAGIGAFTGNKKKKAKATEMKRQAQDKSRAIRSGKGAIKSPVSNIAKPGARPAARMSGGIGRGIRKIGSKIGGMLKRRAGAV